VKTAPRTVPVPLASTTDIISTTYTHATATKYMSYRESLNYNAENSVIAR